METVRVNLGPRSYDIAITGDGAAGVGPFVKAARPKSSVALVVCDENTQSHGRGVQASLAATGLRTGFVTVPAGESSKSMEQLATALQPRGRIHYFINETPDPMAMIWVYAGPLPERIVVDERCAVEPAVAWSA